MRRTNIADTLSVTDRNGPVPNQADRLVLADVWHCGCQKVVGIDVEKGEGLLLLRAFI